MKTLLLVDDDYHMRHLLRFTLGKSGCRLLAAGTGEEAVRIAAEEPIDLAVIDVGLPGIDGFETLRRLRARPGGEALFAVVLTAGARPDFRVPAASSQVLFVTKPFSPIQLRRQIFDLLGIEAPVSAQRA